MNDTKPAFPTASLIVQAACANPKVSLAAGRPAPCEMHDARPAVSARHGETANPVDGKLPLPTGHRLAWCPARMSKLAESDPAPTPLLRR